MDFIEFSATATEAPMNPPPPKPSQVIDMSELPHNHNRKTLNVVSTGLRLSHNREKLLSSFSMLPGDLAGEIKRQRDDLDRFLQTQVFYSTYLVFFFNVCIFFFGSTC